MSGTASSLLSRSLGDVQKQDRTAAAAASAGGARPTPYSRPSDGAKGGTWKHDMYSKAPTNASAGERDGPSRPQAKSAKLVISNLHYDVSERELELLFQQTGPIVSGPKIKFDRSGRSEGKAWVTYGNEEHAAEAKEAFDGAIAKGQQIRVAYDYRLDTLHTRGAAAPGTLLARMEAEDRERERARYGKLRSDAAATTGPGGSSTRGGRSERVVSGGRGRGGARGGGGERREPRAPKTQDDLDKELEAFMNQPEPSKKDAAPAVAPADVEMS